jgi:hypothetical protein
MLHARRRERPGGSGAPPSRLGRRRLGDDHRPEYFRLFAYGPVGLSNEIDFGVTRGSVWDRLVRHCALVVGPRPWEGAPRWRTTEATVNRKSRCGVHQRSTHLPPASRFEPDHGRISWSPTQRRYEGDTPVESAAMSGGTSARNPGAWKGARSIRALTSFSRE